LRGSVAAHDKAAESGEGGGDTADAGFDVGEEDDVTSVVWGLLVNIGRISSNQATYEASHLLGGSNVV
jgi:hypothetical protein